MLGQTPGQGRQLGAVRLRQVRMDEVECGSIPGWMRELYGYEVECGAPYSWGGRSELPIFRPEYPECPCSMEQLTSGEYCDACSPVAPECRDGDDPASCWPACLAPCSTQRLANFSLPFTFQDSLQLNTTRVYSERFIFSRYDQAGYVLDVLPNLPANAFAALLQECAEAAQTATLACMAEQGVGWDYPPPPPTPPPSPAPPPLGSMDRPYMRLNDEMSSEGAVLNLRLEIDVAPEYEINPLEVPFFVINLGGADLNFKLVSEDEARLQDSYVVISQPWGNVRTNEIVERSLRVYWDQEFADLLANNITTRDFPTLTFYSQDFSDMEVATLDITFNVHESLATVFPPPGARRSLQVAKAPSPTAALPAEDLTASAADASVSPSARFARTLAQEGWATDAITDLFGETCEDAPLLDIPNGLDRSACEVYCPLTPYISYEMLADMLSADKCGECKCADYQGECATKCRPKDLFLKQVQALREGAWVDQNTRAVMVDMSYLQSNQGLHTTVRLNFEMPNVGGVHPKARVSTARIYRYVTYGDMVIFGFEMVFMAMVVWYTIEEFIEMRKAGWSYFGDFWNWIDWFNLGMFYATFALRMFAYFLINSFDYEAGARFGVIEYRYIDLLPIVGAATVELDLMAVNLFTLYLKVFKYLQKIPRMDIMIVTVQRAAFDLLLFIFMAFLVMFGFSAAFYVTFGGNLHNYKTLGDALGALNRIALGDFDYAELYDTNPLMAPLLFYTYVAVVFFMLLNMFLAIINDSFIDVKSEQTEEDLAFYRNLRDKIMGQMKDAFKRKEDVNQLAKMLQGADTDMTGLIDEKELAAVLENNPKAFNILQTGGAKELLAKYDVSGDGVLDKNEMTAILKELAEKEAEIQHELDAAQDAEAEMQHKIEEAGLADNMAAGDAAVGGGTGRGGGSVDLSELEARMENIEGSMKEMSRNVAKKLSLMIELMMSLSEQVTSTQAMSPGGVPGGVPMPPPGAPGGPVPPPPR